MQATLSPKNTEAHLSKILRICYDISETTGVPVDDLFGECRDKIVRVLHNFDPRLGKPFEAYLCISMRGYAFNYCRDKSFLKRIPRPRLSLYMKSKKFSSLEDAAIQMRIPLSVLRDIHAEVKNNRPYSAVNVEDEWRLPYNQISDTHDTCRDLIDELVPDDIDFDILNDVNLKETSYEDMMYKYGPDWDIRYVDLMFKFVENYAKAATIFD